MYKLFLDDERWPTKADECVIARSSEEAFKIVLQQGIPSHIFFDHDLGEGDTSIKFIWMMIDYWAENDCVGWPLNFTYSVHSQNPVGSINIMSLMDNFLSSEVGLIGCYRK